MPHATAIKEITDTGGLIAIQLIAADLGGVSTSWSQCASAAVTLLTLAIRGHILSLGHIVACS